MPSGPDRVDFDRIVEQAILTIHNRGVRVVSARDLVAEVQTKSWRSNRIDVRHALGRLSKAGRIHLSHINDIDYLMEDH